MNSQSQRKSTVLLAGGTGFVGEGLRSALREAGYPTRLLVRSTSDSDRLGDLGFETALGDVLDPQALYVAMQGVDAVINLVAIVQESGEATFERINYQGTVNLVDAARRAGVERFIQMSANGAANLPDFPYHYTKWRAECYVQDMVTSWTIIRPSIIFGPSAEGHFQFVGQLAELVRDAPLVPVPGSGSARFQPIHRDDVSASFVRALDDSTTSGHTYEIAGDEVLTYREILDEVAGTLEIDKRKVSVPLSLVRLGATVMTYTPFVESPVTTDQLKMLQLDNTTADNSAPGLVDRPLRPFRGGLGFLRDGAPSE